ncbi:hypothetical protein [Brevibacillus parabrevis]|uniref:hypothetical protein n=1 Tax=Brevibacillus parabrevis TaxID=54914 RepID=UPI002E215D97|nr:hypothetical protein [Brevibacillus parabrevis]
MELAGPAPACAGRFLKDLFVGSDSIGKLNKQRMGRACALLFYVGHTQRLTVKVTLAMIFNDNENQYYNIELILT